MGSHHIFRRAGQSLASMTDRVYHAIGAGPIGRLFTSYQAADNYFRHTALASTFRGNSGKRKNHVVRRGLAAAMDQSVLRRAAYGAVNGLCRCSLRTLGAFFVTLGIYTVLISWLIAAVWQNAAPEGTRVFFAGVMTLIGVLLLFSNQSVAHMLTRGRLIGVLVHHTLGLSDDYIRDIPEKGRTMYASAIPLGMLCGVITAITGIFYPMIAVLVAAVIMVALTTPEAGILLLLVLAPFSGVLPYGEVLLALGVFLSFAGYVFKLMRGTRAFRMEIQDFVVLALLVVTLLSGVSAAGGSALRGVLLSAILMMIYFPAVNILSTPTWLARCRWGLLFSATVVALVGVLQFAVSLLLALQGFQGVSMAVLGEYVRAGFSTHVAFAYFMVLVFPFSLHAFIRAKNSQHRVAAGFSSVAILAATVLTWLPGAWLSVALEIVVLLLFCKRRVFPYFVLLLVALPVVIFFLPPSYRMAILSFFGKDDLFAGAKLSMKIFFGDGGGVLRMLFGVGAEGAQQIGVLYTGGLAGAVTDSLNFWWSQWLAGGILQLLLTVLLFFFLLQNCFSLLPHTPKEQSVAAPISGIAMITGAIVIGFFDFSWSDPVALLLFFILTSVITADARVRRNDRVSTEAIEQSTSCVEFEYRINEKRRKHSSERKEANYEQQNGQE